MKLSNSEKKSLFIRITNILLVVIILAIGGYLLYTNNVKFESSKRESITAKKSLQNENLEGQKIIVDIGGAVKNPGVYKMDKDARVIDLIEKAGGLSEKVDLQYFDKNINKAQKLIDGSKIYIPTVEDKQNTASHITDNVLGVSTSFGLININTASRKELIDLPGIGEVTADKIIAARPYNSIEELVTKGVLRQSQLDKIKDKISY